MTKLFTLVFATSSFSSLSAFSSTPDKPLSLETSKALEMPYNTYIAENIWRYTRNNATLSNRQIAEDYTERKTTLDISELTAMWFGNNILLDFVTRKRYSIAL